MDDWKLIRAYAEQQSEAAFRELVERHAGLVYGSALRQVRDPQLAEDVAQTVFILLARKARQLPSRTVLAGWLFNTTRFVASRAMRSELRRQRREQEALQMNQLHSLDETWRRMEPVVDEALGEMNRTDREALLLRFFEGRSLRETGSALGVNEEAAKKRVSRALDRLREALRGRGLVISAGALSAAMTQQASAAAPLLLVNSLTAAALSSAASGGAAGLTAEVLRAWVWIKMKWAAGGAAIAVASAIILTTQWTERGTTGQTQAETDSVEQLSVASTQPQAQAESEQASVSPVANRFLQLRVVAADNGEPIANARVGRNYVVHREWLKSLDLVTDASGVCAVPFPAETLRLDVVVFASGWTTRAAVWPSEGTAGIPNEYTLRLERVTNSIGGRVQDSAGRPVADVEIWFYGRMGSDSSHRERPRERFGFFDMPVTTTDARGRWNVAFVPPRHPGFQISAKHPDFADTSVISSGTQESLAEITDAELRQLWAGELVTTMNPAFTLAGLVVDEQQRPVAAAKIQHREQGDFFRTDASGQFRVPRLKPGTWPFTVSADGFAPVRREAEIRADMNPLVITLQTGAVLILRLVDEFEAGVAGATVGLEQWGPHRSALEWRVQADAFGRVEWPSAPRDMDLELYALSDEHCWTRDIRLKADGREHVIRLRHKLDVYGRVVDAEAGHGIPTFKAMPGYGGPDRYYDSEQRWFAGETVRGTNGLFKLTFVENQLPWQVRVIADGYEDWISPPLTNYMHVALDIEMKKSSVSNSVRGVVLQPNGEPVANAQVALLTFEHNVGLQNRVFEGNPRWLTRTAADGTFRFPFNALAHSVAAVNDSGYVRLRVPDVREAVTLTLQPWARVEVTVDESARTQPVESIQLGAADGGNYKGHVRLSSFSALAGADGKFTFEEVPPGELCVTINSGIGIPSHHATVFTAKPGELMQVTIRGRPGAIIQGRLVPLPFPSVQRLDDFVSVSIQVHPITTAFRFSADPDVRLRQELDFWTSPAGRERLATRRTFRARVSEDGSFVSLERVPPGNYRVLATFKTTSASQSLVVEDNAAGVIDVGDVHLR